MPCCLPCYLCHTACVMFQCTNLHEECIEAGFSAEDSYFNAKKVSYVKYVSMCQCINVSMCQCTLVLNKYSSGILRTFISGASKQVELAKHMVASDQSSTVKSPNKNST